MQIFAKVSFFMRDGHPPYVLHEQWNADGTITRLTSDGTALPDIKKFVSGALKEVERRQVASRRLQLSLFDASQASQAGE